MKTHKMRPATLLLIGFFAINALLLSACSMPIRPGTREAVTQEMDFEDFNEVEISDGFSVKIRQGDEFRVTIEIDEALLTYLDVSKVDEQLKIGLGPHKDFFANPDSVRRAEIIMPTLVGVNLGNASSLNGEFDTGDLWLIVDNASDAILTGQGQNLTLRVEEASSVNLADFVVQDATVTMTNASSATMNVAGRLDAEVSNFSSIAYYGNPTLGNTRTSIASSITARNR